MRDVILTGMMGGGKSTVARLLARQYGMDLLDTDAEIERRVGCSIAEFWSRHSESAFRDLEAKVWADAVLSNERRIIATGAGTLISELNRSRLQRDQTVHCLTAPVSELTARLTGGGDSRPLLDENDLPATLARCLAQREHVYSQFQQIPTSGRSVNQVAAEVAERASLDEVGSLAADHRHVSSIHFGHGLFRTLGDRTLATQDRRVLMVTDENVVRAGWADVVEDSLTAGHASCTRIVLAPGEEHKSLATVQTLYRACRRVHLDRESLILGVGGGVVGDLAGMVAATYLRGIQLVLAPTTLLAQVDAAIGGKVGVDMDGIKNLVGAFYPASEVLIDPDALTTLGMAQLADGIAEVIKIGAIRCESLLRRVENLSDVSEVLAHPQIVRQAAAAKLRVVQADPLERGERALLNFGHTVGHAVEAASDYTLSHGDSIAIGMVAETWLAERRGWCSAPLTDRLRKLLYRFGLPVKASYLDKDAVYRFLLDDKKRRGERVRMAIPIAAGQGRVVEVDDDDARAAIAHALGEVA